MTNLWLDDPRLGVLYQRTTGPVTFVDESYRAYPMDGERPFYSMSGVTFEVAQFDRVRDVLTEIAQGRRWHTTTAFRLGRDHDIAEMCQFVASKVEWNVVAVEVTIPEGGMEAARQTCLAALAREVTRGHGPEAVRLLVADRTNEPRINRADQRTVAALRSAGDIDANVTLYHGRMAEEPLLWTADAVSWAAYRNLALDDGCWIEPVRDVLTVVDAASGLAVDMKQPWVAAANSRAPQTTSAEREQSAVVSRPTIHPDTGNPEGFRQGTAVMDDLVKRVRELRRRIGPQGMAAGNTPAAVRNRFQQAAQATREQPPTQGPEPPQRGHGLSR